MITIVIGLLLLNLAVTIGHALFDILPSLQKPKTQKRPEVPLSQLSLEAETTTLMGCSIKRYQNMQGDIVWHLLNPTTGLVAEGPSLRHAALSMYHQNKDEQ